MSHSWAKDYADAIIQELKEFFQEATGLVFDIDDSVLWGIGVAFVFFFYYCSCCSCDGGSSKKKDKKEKEKEKDETKDKKTDGTTTTTDKDGNKKAPRVVYKKKSIAIAYFLLFFGGLQGAHHFYLGDVITGTSYIFTLGFFGFGYLYDVLTLWYRIMKKNKRATKDAEIGFKRLCVRVFCQMIPAIVGAAWVTCIVIGLGAPFILHYTGMVDLYKRRGNLTLGAYELLEVGRIWTHEDLKKNFKRQSLKYHPDRNSNCGEMYKSCTQRMQELNVAHDLLLGGILDLEAIVDDWYSVDDCAKDWLPYYGQIRDDIANNGFDKWSENMQEQIMAAIGAEDPATAKARKKAEKKKQKEAEKLKREEQKRQREEEKRERAAEKEAQAQEKEEEQSKSGESEEDMEDMDTNVLIDMLGPDYDLLTLKKLFEDGAAKREARLKSEEEGANGGGEAKAAEGEAEKVEEAKAAEEPKVEEAKAAEEPKVEEAKAAEEPKVEEAKAAEEPKVEEAPKTEEKKTEL